MMFGRHEQELDSCCQLDTVGRGIGQVKKYPHQHRRRDDLKNFIRKWSNDCSTKESVCIFETIRLAA